ncbi:unnamed protein product [Boreogadus saida]
MNQPGSWRFLKDRSPVCGGGAELTDAVLTELTELEGVPVRSRSVDSLFLRAKYPGWFLSGAPSPGGTLRGRGGDQRAATNVNRLCTDPDAAGV